MHNKLSFLYLFFTFKYVSILTTANKDKRKNLFTFEFLIQKIDTYLPFKFFFGILAIKLMKKNKL